MTAGCIHQCDDDGWLWAESGLMPCPRHRTTEHERWASGAHRPSGGTSPTGAPTTDEITTGRAGLARARAALNPPERRNP